jgi:hypothetical protein
MEMTRSFWRSRSHFGIGAQRFGVATHCTFFLSSPPIVHLFSKKNFFTLTQPRGWPTQIPIPPPQPNPAGAPALSLAIRHRKSRVLPPAAPRRFAAGSSSLSSTNPRGLSPSSARPQPSGWPSGPTPPTAGHDCPLHVQQSSDQGNTTSSEGYYQIIRFWDFFVDCYLNLCTRNSNLVSLMYCGRDFGLIKDWRFQLVVKLVVTCAFNSVKNCSGKWLRLKVYFLLHWIYLYNVLFVCPLVKFWNVCPNSKSSATSFVMISNNM